MADKTISQLTAAPSALGEYTGQELFVLEQNNTAKKLTMQILENWLVSFADGHGGIQTISKTGTSGLVDTYTITFADQSTATFTVTNGNGITGVTQYWAVSSSNTTVPSSWSTTRQTMTPTNKYLWSYMTFKQNSGTFSTTKSVVGVYGDTGQAWYVWIRYAGQRPTSDADIGTEPDNWMGVYSGTQTTAPTSYTSYQWFEIKGETGNTGATGASVASVTRTGGTGEPGSTDTYTITLDNGTVAGTFTVYNGLNGTGAVATVNGVQPDQSGNVALTAANINTSGGQTVQATLTDLSESKQTRITANGILKGNGSGGVSAAVAGTDYLTPATNYSPLSRVAGGTVRVLTSADVGKTFWEQWTSTIQNEYITYELTEENSVNMPLGTEIAFLTLFAKEVRIKFTNIRAFHSELGFFNEGRHTITVKAAPYNLVAMKKIDKTYGTSTDCWLLTGNVEVVS